MEKTKSSPSPPTINEGLSNSTKRALTSMKQPYIACNRFLLLHKLGKGGFGLIYAGVDLQTHKEVAIKLEDISRARKKYLKLEYQIYQRYHSDWTHIPFNQKVSIPTIYYYGQDGGYRVLVMDLLGPSMSELFTFQFERFSLKTVCMLAIKMITVVEHLHSKGLLHRDIKPGNFVMGRGIHGNEVYLIDYGLASPYIDANGVHISYSTNARFHGTDKYASVNIHKKIEPGRRDDMQSLGYLFLYYLTGNLPWAKKYRRIKKKHRRLAYGKLKMKMTIEELTQGLPPALYHYFKSVESLYFADKPDYDYLRHLFLDILKSNGYEYDDVYDWTLPDKIGDEDENDEEDDEEDEDTTSSDEKPTIQKVETQY